MSGFLTYVWREQIVTMAMNSNSRCCICFLWHVNDSGIGQPIPIPGQCELSDSIRHVSSFSDRLQ